MASRAGCPIDQMPVHEASRLSDKMTSAYTAPRPTVNSVYGGIAPDMSTRMAMTAAIGPDASRNHGHAWCQAGDGADAPPPGPAACGEAVVSEPAVSGRLPAETSIAILVTPSRRPGGGASAPSPAWHHAWPWFRLASGPIAAVIAILVLMYGAITPYTEFTVGRGAGD